MQIISICFIAIIFLTGATVYLWRRSQTLKQQLARFGKAESKPDYVRCCVKTVEDSLDVNFVVEVGPAGKLYFKELNQAAVHAIDFQGIGFAGQCFDDIAKRSGNPELRRIMRELTAQLKLVVDTGKSVDYESTFCLADETVSSIFDFSLVPMACDNGFRHILCIGRDVTIRKLYEQESAVRAKLEAQLSGFAACAPSLLYTYRHDADGNNSMPFASAGISEIFGLRPEDVAESIAPMLLHIHSDDIPIFIEALANSAADLSPLAMEFRVQHPGKGERWIESCALSVLESDGSLVWYGFMHDITQRKRIELALTNNQEALNDAQRIGNMGSWELDWINGALTWSAEIYRIFEIDPQSRGASFAVFWDTIHPDDREVVNNAYIDLLVNRIPYGIDYRLLLADGRIKYARECCETYFDEDDKPLRSRGTVQDITVLKETELRLKETQDRMRELVVNREILREEERKHIAWEMHEELGQLLAAMKLRIYGMCSLIPNDIPPLHENSQVTIGLIDQAIESIRGLVSALRPAVLQHGIAAALEWVISEFNKQSDIVCELGITEDDTLIGDELTTLVFRLVQELLEDTCLCAETSRIIISWVSNQVGSSLTIQFDCQCCLDDSVSNKTLRLFGMRTRVEAFGGTLRMSKIQGLGTLIEMHFPQCKTPDHQYMLPLD